jgi:tetratricopeptide (TPR) repeat protein
MFRKIGPAVVGFALTVAMPQMAFADDAGVKRADALFQEGRTAVREGNWERGCPKFEESLRLDPAPGTRINLGECEERTGHLVAALELYEQASRELPQDDRRLPLAKQRAQAADARIPRLVVPANVHVRIDDDTAVKTGELRLDPGHHTVVVIADGRERTTVVTLAEKERRTVEPEVSPAIGAPAAASSTRVIGYAVGGVGLAALATGLVFGGLVLHDKNVIEASCDKSNACLQEGLDAKSEGKTFSAVSTVAVGVGLVALAVGIYLVVSSPRSTPPRVGLEAVNVRF